MTNGPDHNDIDALVAIMKSLADPWSDDTWSNGWDLEDVNPRELAERIVEYFRAKVAT